MSSDFDDAQVTLPRVARQPAEHTWGISVSAIAVETVNDYLFCMSAWSGLLIQATVGMWGGRGRPANRDGFASNAALKVWPSASSNGRCTVPAWLIREGQDGRC